MRFFYFPDLPDKLLKFLRAEKGRRDLNSVMPDAQKHRYVSIMTSKNIKIDGQNHLSEAVFRDLQSHIRQYTNSNMDAVLNKIKETIYQSPEILYITKDPPKDYIGIYIAAAINDNVAEVDCSIYEFKTV